MKQKLVLVSMPFGSLSMPSLALGLLASIAESKQIPTKTLYFTFDFADEIGIDLYEKVSDGYPASQDLVGEWIFSEPLWKMRQSERQYVNQVLLGSAQEHSKQYRKSNPDADFVNGVLRARHLVPQFLQSCLKKILSENPTIVGFTSVFQQSVPSLVLGHLVKQVLPRCFVAFGGANCEDPMGTTLINKFQWIDAIVSGEGEAAFASLLDAISGSSPLANTKNVHLSLDAGRRISIKSKAEPVLFAVKAAISRSEDQELATRKSSRQIEKRSLDAMPTPNFGDYFRQLDGWSGKAKIHPRLLMETSRGCWWGEKHHCTFCGLNGGSMTFRSKSPERVLQEIDELCMAHPGYPLSFVDNILDMKYFTSVIPQLEKSSVKHELFFEVKANLRREQVKALRNARIAHIQPGIESLSDEVLNLMRKGITGLQNIQLLKWCKEFGIRAEWNILYGFPGELPSHYHKMISWMQRLGHLTPPGGVGQIRMDRFSPNFEQFAEFGFKNVRAYPSYSYVFPFDLATVNDLAYFFAFDYSTELPFESYVPNLISTVREWQQRFDTSDLFCIDDGTHLIICDTRSCAKKPVHILRALHRITLLTCERIASHQDILLAAKTLAYECQLDGLLPVIAQLEAENLLLVDGDHLLSLPIAHGEYMPCAGAMQNLFSELKKTGAEFSEGQTYVSVHHADAAATL